MTVSKAGENRTAQRNTGQDEEQKKDTKGRVKGLLISGGLMAAVGVATGGAGLAVKFGAGVAAKLAPNIAKAGGRVAGKVGGFVSGAGTAAQAGGTKTSGHALQAALDRGPTQASA